MEEWLPSWVPHQVIRGAVPRRDVRTAITSEREAASREWSLPRPLSRTCRNRAQRRLNTNNGERPVHCFIAYKTMAHETKGEGSDE